MNKNSLNDFFIEKISPMPPIILFPILIGISSFYWIAWIIHDLDYFFQKTKRRMKNGIDSNGKNRPNR